MGPQVKWYATSLVIHAGLLALMLILAANVERYVPPIRIDFTLSACSGPEPPRKKAETVAVRHPQPVVATTPTPVKPKPKPVKPRPVPAIKTVVPTPVPVVEPIPVVEAVEEPSEGVAESPAAPLESQPVTVSEVAPSGEGVGTGETSAEQMRESYLREHYTGIRDRIIKGLTYPMIARRMGWSGRVVLSFTVTEDGGVHSIQIRESSGYAALDKKAMETVRNAAPFPRPPTTAEIVMPVQFRLQ